MPLKLEVTWTDVDKICKYKNILDKLGSTDE